jgi:hypothetical protein
MRQQSTIEIYGAGKTEPADLVEFQDVTAEDDDEEVGDIESVIRKKGGQHCVESESGKNLGCSPSKGGAKKRLAQVEYFKHKKG